MTLQLVHQQAPKQSLGIVQRTNIQPMQRTARQYGQGVSHLDEHVRWMIRAGRSERTIRARRQTLTYLRDHLHKDPFLATLDDLERWQDSLPQQQIRHKTALIRPYFGWVHAKGYRSDDPSKLLVTPPARLGIPRPIGTADLFHALDLAPDRIAPWLLLAAWCGLRAKEIAGLTAECFHYRDGHWYAHLTVTKGGRERVVPVPGWVWARISHHVPDRGPLWQRERGTGPVTAQHVSQYCNDHLHKCGVRATLHMLRHWHATEFYEASEDLRATQAQLGHADSATTSVYTQVRPEKLALVSEALPVPPGWGSRLRVA